MRAIECVRVYVCAGVGACTAALILPSRELREETEERTFTSPHCPLDTLLAEQDSDAVLVTFKVREGGRP